MPFPIDNFGGLVPRLVSQSVIVGNASLQTLKSALTDVGAGVSRICEPMGSSFAILSDCNGRPSCPNAEVPSISSDPCRPT